MKQYAMESKGINRSKINKSFSISLHLLVATTFLLAQQPPPAGVRLEVIAVRVLSDKEAAERSPDFIGPNVAVRLRLSSTLRGISFYAWKNSPIPVGYKILRTGNGNVWLYGKGGTEKKPSSPGINAVLFGSKGEWLTLPPCSAIEWEDLDSTFFVGEMHSFSIFVKERDKGGPKEIFSDHFVVPAVPAEEGQRE
jgi:hypothetical protein